MASVVDKDVSKVHETDRIIGDLGADSLDLLDLVFQLERRFGIRISPNGIEKGVRATLGSVPLEIDGVYTSEALALLRAALPEVPPGEIPEGFHASRLPQVFRVATFIRLVVRLLEERG